MTTETDHKPTGTPEDTREDRSVAALWALPVAVTMWVWVAGWLPMWTRRAGGVFPEWMMPAVGVAFALIGVMLSRTRWTADRYGPGMDVHGAVLSVFVGGAAGGWLTWAAYTSPWQTTPVLLIAGVIGGAWWAMLEMEAMRRWREPERPQAAAAPHSEEAAMRSMLDASNNADIAILKYEENRSGQSWLLGPRTVNEDGTPATELPDFADFTSRLPRLSTHLAAYWRRRNVEFDDGDIRPEPVKVDRWYLHINTLHVEKEPVTPDMAPTERRSWNMPVWLGLFLDGGPMTVGLHGIHMRIIGATGFGKTVVANNIIRAGLKTVDPSTGTRDHLFWVCATDKLVPFVWPWLDPYFRGSMDYPALDWVAGQDPQSVLRFLRSVYFFCRDRNARLTDESKHPASAAMPGITVIWEEAQHGGNLVDTIDVNGEPWTISRLGHEIMTVARSAGVGTIALTQSGLTDALGEYSDLMLRNQTVRACTRTNTDFDGYYNLPALSGQGVNTTQLRNFTMYLQPSIDVEPRAIPGKAAYIDGTDTIRPLLLAEVAPHRPPTLPAEDLRALGEEYAQRWDPALLPELHRAVEVKRQKGDAALQWRVYGQVDTVPVTHTPAAPAATIQPAPTSSVDTYGVVDTGKYGLPGEASLSMLEQLAENMMRQADEESAALAAETAGPDDVGAGLPEPLAGLVRALDEITQERGPVEWIATTEVCERVWGMADRVTVTRFGRAIQGLLPTLRTTDPRPYGDGQRGRGWIVADLLSAVALYRAEHGA